LQRQETSISTCKLTSGYIRIMALHRLCFLGLEIASVSLLPWNLTTLQASLQPLEKLALVRESGPGSFTGGFRCFLEILVTSQQSQPQLSPVIGFAAYSIGCGKWNFLTIKIKHSRAEDFSTARHGGLELSARARHHLHSCCPGV
jgi:hypothetical protein